MEIDNDLAYLTGFFDGEGCVVLQKNGSICLHVTNTNINILNEFVDRFGGVAKFRNKGVNKPIYSWRVFGQDAYLAATEMLKFSRDKAPQLIAALDWIDRRDQYTSVQKVGGRGHVANPERAVEIKRIQTIMTKMKMGAYA